MIQSKTDALNNAQEFFSSTLYTKLVTIWSGFDRKIVTLQQPVELLLILVFYKNVSISNFKSFWTYSE